MNCMALFAVGGAVEKKIGTDAYFLFCVYAVWFTTVLYISIYYFVSVLSGDILWMSVQSIGISAVVFALAVVESFAMPPNSTRSFCCVANVPARFYPILLLIALQLALSRVSLVGHLCGVCFGLLFVSGNLKRLFDVTYHRGFGSYLERVTGGYGESIPAPSDDDIYPYAEIGLPDWLTVTTSLASIRNRFVAEETDDMRIESESLLVSEEGRTETTEEEEANLRELRSKRIKYFEGGKTTTARSETVSGGAGASDDDAT
eukprot:g1513.t1